MRLGFWATTVLALIACDQAKTAEFNAEWTGSLGRLVIDGSDPNALTFAHLDGAGPEQGGMTVVSVDDDAKAREAVRLETLGQPARMESLQAKLLSTSNIDVDETCWLRFDARALQPQVELGLGRLSIAVQATDPGRPPLFQRTIYLEPAWTAIDLMFAAPADLGAGEAEVTFAVGTQLQVIDIASISMRCFEDDRAIARIPPTSFSYAGREADASWRAVAEAQIERYRKGDLAISVVDQAGRPVGDAEIHIQMSRHAFKFGAAIDADLLAGATSDNDIGNAASYRKNLEELFNTITIEDGLSWTAWADPERRQRTEEALGWVRSLGLDLVGRGMVSTSGLELPEALRQEGADEAAIRGAIRDGVTATAGDLGDRVRVWDVVDRPRDHHDLLDVIGRDEIGTWFQLIRSAAPDARLILSESDILVGDRTAELAGVVAGLLDDGVPIDGIGVDGTFGAQPPPVRVLIDRLDQLASFDLPLVITDFDVATSDGGLQQDFIRDFLTIAFSHPSVESITFGRYWETEDDAAIGAGLYRPDGTITAIGNIYRNLVLGRWWTDIVAISNVEGELSTRVFQGDYMISARKDDQSATATLSLGPDGASVTLTLAAKSADDRAAFNAVRQ